MAYSAIEKMRKKNRQIYGRDVGPMQPALSAGAATGSDLKSAALRFLHERCEGLLFDRQIEEEEDRTAGSAWNVNWKNLWIPRQRRMPIQFFTVSLRSFSEITDSIKSRWRC